MAGSARVVFDRELKLDNLPSFDNPDWYPDYAGKAPFTVVSAYKTLRWRTMIVRTEDGRYVGVGQDTTAAALRGGRTLRSQVGGRR